jgi:UDP-galactopyranose mutase
MRQSNSILVVGAGFSGAVIARELAESGRHVVVIDKRDHVAGNAYDFTNEFGIRIHKYGPHLFHTSNDKVVEWLSKFTDWTPYHHKVKALLSDGRLVTLPVNKETTEIVGKENVLDIFFRPYTRKMWGIELEQIDRDIINRVPIRDDMNELYFPNDTFQALPTQGYTRTVERILDHPNIEFHRSTPFERSMEADFEHIFNSMPIDEYFEFRFDRLPYRSIKFHTYNLPVPKVFPVATVNFTHSEPYTRVTEWKNLPGHGLCASHTTVTVEEPCSDIDNHYERYYPVKDSDGKNLQTLQKYKSIENPRMTFIGRCGLYAYLDMHQAINSALSVAARYIEASKQARGLSI